VRDAVAGEELQRVGVAEQRVFEREREGRHPGLMASAIMQE
jgi:hypothetical protein